jgi:hypothetical protein
LETRDHAHLAGRQALTYPVAFDLQDLRLHVRRIGDDPGLATGEADRLDTEICQGHAQQRHGDSLPGRDQHVHLAAGLRAGDVVGQLDEVVGGLAHRARNDDDIMAVTSGESHVLGDCTHAVWIGDGGAAVFLHDEGHGIHRLAS